METFKDIFKNNFLENFTSDFSLKYILTAMLISLVFAGLIYLVYKLTCDKTIYSRKFNTAMSLMTIIVAGIILAMQANVVVSLGMVGALSIIRYRTAIKESRDLLFLFWATANGIIIGTGLYSLVLILFIIVSVALLLFDVVPSTKKPMLLVINSNSIDIEKELETIFKNNNIKYNVKSRNIHNLKMDLIYEINMKNELDILKEINKLDSITNINLISQDN